MSIIKFKMEDRCTHEHLSMAFNTLVGRAVRDMLKAEGNDEFDAKPLAESAAWAVAMVFDDGKIKVNGETFTPVLSFLGPDGSAVPVEGHFELHDYAVDVLEYDEYD